MKALKPAATAGSAKTNLLPPFEYRIIFSNIHSIVKLNSQFVSDLKGAKGDNSMMEGNFLSAILKHASIDLHIILFDLIHNPIIHRLRDSRSMPSMSVPLR